MTIEVGRRSMDDQTEYSTEARPRRAMDRTYVARLEFLTTMHLLRLDVADAAVLVDSLKEDHVRIGRVTVPVLEQITRALTLLHAMREIGMDQTAALMALRASKAADPLQSG